MILRERFLDLAQGFVLHPPGAGRGRNMHLEISYKVFNGKSVAVSTGDGGRKDILLSLNVGPNVPAVPDR